MLKMLRFGLLLMELWLLGRKPLNKQVNWMLSGRFLAGGRGERYLNILKCVQNTCVYVPTHMAFEGAGRVRSSSLRS